MRMDCDTRMDSFGVVELCIHLPPSAAVVRIVADWVAVVGLVMPFATTWEQLAAKLPSAVDCCNLQLVLVVVVDGAGRHRGCVVGWGVET